MSFYASNPDIYYLRSLKFEDAFHVEIIFFSLPNGWHHAAISTPLGHAAVEFLAALAAVSPSAEAKNLKARRELIQLANSYRESFPSQAKEILELARRD